VISSHPTDPSSRPPSGRRRMTIAKTCPSCTALQCRARSTHAGAADCGCPRRGVAVARSSSWSSITALRQQFAAMKRGQKRRQHTRPCSDLGPWASARSSQPQRPLAESVR
jgi:hypothetical protein